MLFLHVHSSAGYTRHQVRVAAIVVVWGAMLAAGCGSSGYPSASEEPTTLTVGLASEPASVGPIVQALTTQRLVGTSPNGRHTPGLLERWSTSPDGLTWDLVVRADAMQHDGRPVTADQVVGLLQEQAQGPYAPAGLWDIERFEAVDNRVLRLHLREPSSLVLEALTLTRALPVGPFVEQPRADDDPSLPVLLANPLQAPGDPVERVAFRRYESPRAAWSALLRDEIDFLYEVSNDARPFLERAPGVQVRSFIRPYVLTLGLNNRHPVLEQPAVRLALNYAVDREELLQKDHGGRGRVAAGHAWPSHWAADGTLAFPFDQARARQLLDDLGLPVVERPDGPPSRFRIRCLVSERFERVALRLRRSYAAIGVDLELELLPGEDFEERLAAGTFEAFLLPLMSGYGTNALYQMWSGQARGRSVDFGYTAAADAVERMRRARSDDEFREALRAVQRIQYDDPPAVFLVWARASRAVGRRFEVPTEQDRDILSTLARWRPVAVPKERAR